MAFNKALKEARLRAGYTQQQVSAETHIPLGTLRRWEQGVNEPDSDSLVVLLDLYEASADEVLGSGFCAPGLRPRPGLTLDELHLLDLYRATDARGRLAIMTVAESQQGVEGPSAGAVSA